MDATPVEPACPHCQMANPSHATFCGSCGKALPQGGSAQPRVLMDDALAESEVGQEMQSQELKKKARSAAGALLAVAIIQTVVTGLLFFVTRAQVADNPDLELDPVFFIVLGGIAAIFWGLWVWSRQNPLPAAIVGLVLILSFWFVDFVLDPTSLVRGIIVKVIIIAVLVKAIKAGAQHRRLQREIAGG